MTPSLTAAQLPLTQTEQVLEYLRTRGPLTQPAAQEQIGCLRLGARIWDLKRRGHAIATELVELASGQRVAEYTLVREADPSRSVDRPAAAPGSRSRARGPRASSDLTALRTIDDAITAFGDLATELGVPPTVRELQTALGAGSESVAHRWLRVLEREGLLTVNLQLGGTAARGWRITPSGYERLYALEHDRRVAAERRAVRA